MSWGDVTTCTLSESDCKAVRREVVDSGEQRLRKVQSGGFTVINRVFYKELKEGAYKVIDVNIILLK